MVADKGCQEMNFMRKTSCLKWIARYLGIMANGIRRAPNNFQQLYKLIMALIYAAGTFFLGFGSLSEFLA